jgi:hypothetical protein
MPTGLLIAACGIILCAESWFWHAFVFCPLLISLNVYELCQVSISPETRGLIVNTRGL